MTTNIMNNERSLDKRLSKICLLKEQRGRDVHLMYKQERDGGEIMYLKGNDIKEMRRDRGDI